MKVLDSSSDEFGTPQWLYELLDQEYRFTVDAAASQLNKKHFHYWTKEDDALTKSWRYERVFCNPPYSRGNVVAFVRKAYEETCDDCDLAVLLVPTRTEQVWFHNLCRFPRCLVYPVVGRLKFEGGASSARDNHMILVFRNWRFAYFDNKETGKDRRQNGE